MIIKSFQVFRIKDTQTLTSLRAKALDLALSDQPAGDPTGSQWRYLGFVPPHHQADTPLYVYDGAYKSRLFCVEIRERVLPSNTVNRIVKERASKLEATQGYKVNRKHYAQIKDDVIQDLLPKSHIKTSQVPVLLCDNLLIVGTPSPKVCDEVTHLLRETVVAHWGTRSFKLETFDPMGAATQWLGHVALEGYDPAHREDDDLPRFTARESGTIFSNGKHVGTIKLKDVPIDSPEVIDKLTAGWKVKDLSVQWGDALLFTLTQSCIFKGFKFADIVLNEEPDSDEVMAAQALDSALALIASHLSKMLTQLGDGFDILVPPKAQDATEEDDEL